MALHQHSEFDQKQSSGGQKALLVAFLLNFCFTIIEWVGGWLTDSLAILSDAFHDLGDTLMLGAALFFERLSRKAKNSRYTYGYRRFSILSSLINATILAVGSIVIVFHAVPRFIEPTEVHSRGMFLIALIGLLFNAGAVFSLRRSGDASLNLQTAMLHLSEDVLGWAAVLLGAAVIYFTDWLWVDPLLSIFIALYIFRGSVGQLRKSTRILLQAVPKDVDLVRIEGALTSIPKVIEVHDIRAWSLDGEQNVMSFHMVVKDGASIKEVIEIKKEVWRNLSSNNIHHFTVEIERENEQRHEQYAI